MRLEINLGIEHHKLLFQTDRIWAHIVVIRKVMFLFRSLAVNLPLKIELTMAS
jgi:hypothetical protein